MTLYTVRRWCGISSIEKLREKFYKKPIAKDLTFNDAKRLLEYYGCIFTDSSGGSHFAVKHSGVRGTLTLPRHAQQNLKRYNVRDITKFIDEINEKEEK